MMKLAFLHMTDIHAGGSGVGGVVVLMPVLALVVQAGIVGGNGVGACVIRVWCWSRVDPPTTPATANRHCRPAVPAAAVSCRDVTATRLRQSGQCAGCSRAAPIWYQTNRPSMIHHADSTRLGQGSGQVRVSRAS
jgi:hypothetical protein